MTALYQASHKNLKESLEERMFDVESFLEIYNVIAKDIFLLDRANNNSGLPFNGSVYKDYLFPTNLNNPLTYEECCLKRAEEIIERSKKVNKKIALMWSGGIDSTLMLISFLKLNVDKNQIIILLSPESISENQKFYETFVRRKFSIESSDNYLKKFDGNHLIVSGEHNDQLFGTDISMDYYKEYGLASLNQPYSRNNITAFFKLKRCSDHAANLWFDFLEHSMKSSPKQLISIGDVFWWYNFNLKWQHVGLKLFLRMSENQIESTVGEDLFYTFFSSTDFQVWALTTNENLTVAKDTPKRLIYEFDKDENYYKNKIKIPSATIFYSKPMAAALTDEYKLISFSNFNNLDFYNSNNFFNMY